MALILGAVSLFVAFLALWMVSEATNRMNNQNDAFVKAHVRGINTDIDELTVSLMESDKVTNGLSERIDLLEAELNDQKSARADSMKTMAELEKSARPRNEGQPAFAAYPTHQDSPGRHSFVDGKRGAA